MPMVVDSFGTRYGRAQHYLSTSTMLQCSESPGPTPTFQRFLNKISLLVARSTAQAEICMLRALRGEVIGCERFPQRPMTGIKTGVIGPIHL